MVPNSSVSATTEDPCNYYPAPYLRQQFYLVSVGGTSVAIVSIVHNAILFYLFITRPFFRRSHYFYLTILTVFDLIHSCSYIVLMPVCLAFEYTENLYVMEIWYQYAIPLFTLSHVVLTASVYLLVAASVERYMTANWISGFYTKSKRACAIFIVVFLAVLNKGTTFFEMEVDFYPQCTGLAQYLITLTPWARDPLVTTVWRFYYRNIACTFLPFATLLFFNIAIVLHDNCSSCNFQRKAKKRAKQRKKPRSRHWRKNSSASPSPIFDGKSADQRRETLIEEGTAVAFRTGRWIQKAKGRVRKASTRTLIVILLEYLICHSFSVVVTTWEHVDKRDLIYSRYKFYTFASDVISLLTVFSCAIRLPTYCLCDVTLREELRWLLLGYSRKFLQTGHKKSGQGFSSPEFDSLLPPPGDLPRNKSADLGQLVIEAVKHKSFADAKGEADTRRKLNLMTRRQNARIMDGGFRDLAKAAVSQQRAAAQGDDLSTPMIRVTPDLGRVSLVEEAGRGHREKDGVQEHAAKKFQKLSKAVMKQNKQKIKTKVDPVEQDQNSTEMRRILGQDEFQSVGNEVSNHGSKIIFGLSDLEEPLPDAISRDSEETDLEMQLDANQAGSSWKKPREHNSQDVTKEMKQHENETVTLSIKMSKSAKSAHLPKNYRTTQGGFVNPGHNRNESQPPGASNPNARSQLFHIL